MAAALTLLSLSPTPHPLLHKPKQTNLSSSKITFLPTKRKAPILSSCILHKQNTKLTLLGAAGVALTTALLAVGPTYASELPLLGSSSSLQFTEPSNALSLPTWTVHVSSVVEWVIAMALVWQYGERSGYESWKGLSWGMVPLLGGALCACTWHFFYNSESLEVLVALQAALTVIGNATMCIAAYRIYKSSQESSKN